ncbi:hypothetical protein HDU83_005997 [Entophlyctis luteolus]|nr:hypothetical protein HDU83_005997 [Entophlyctis luteolus]KAJ3392124.1 hypothetical protein HDU84_004833 [Entophlyctis sp. JEL0112]
MKGIPSEGSVPQPFAFRRRSSSRILRLWFLVCISASMLALIVASSILRRRHIDGHKYSLRGTTVRFFNHSLVFSIHHQKHGELIQHSEKPSAFKHGNIVSNFHDTLSRLSSYDTGRYAIVPYAAFETNISSSDLGEDIPITKFDDKRIIEYARRDLKYFHECGSDAKRDERFADRSVCPTIIGHSLSGRYKASTTHHDFRKCHKTLVAALAAWSAFAEKAGLFWWISHGELLGWYWNAQFLPWDVDLDVQVPVQALRLLALYNQTIIDDRFLIDVAPSIFVRTPQLQNTVDARLIDTHSGYFIDVTGVARTQSTSEKLFCKTPHPYNYDELVPLIETHLEGIPVWRPRAAMAILVEEYHEKALWETRHRPLGSFQTYVWNKDSHRWALRAR